MPIKQNKRFGFFFSSCDLPSHGVLAQLIVSGMSPPYGVGFKCQQKWFADTCNIHASVEPVGVHVRLLGIVAHKV